MPDFLADRSIWMAFFPAAEIAAVGLAFAWGAVLGSFVNVVLHRVPRRESVVAGGSRCPACGAAIRPRDNIPVLGWILLRGRCRDCGSPISCRYPLIEAACGLLAAAVAVTEIVGGGRWLPQLAAGRQDIDRLLLHGEWRLLVSWALHTLLLITILAWSLLDRTAGRRGSPGWFVATIAIVAVVAAVPEIGPPEMLCGEQPWPQTDRRLAVVAASCTGLLVGWLWGGLTAGAADRHGLALIGAATGWQAVTVVAVVTALIRWGSRTCLRQGPLENGQFDPLTTVAAAQIIFWRPLHEAWMTACRAIGGA
jgi:prepilin signal peptidase PulO-like enzyme (type II secretory pathway)